ncbi:MAG: NHL repeat-containing protein, partial [Armatimonadetes bacterium]|nr:NHL repeat-containing protein [Armatimonadota bacterium]
MGNLQYDSFMLTHDELLAFTLDQGVTSVVFSSSSPTYPLRQPAAAVGRLVWYWIVDNGDGLVRVLNRRTGESQVFAFRGPDGPVAAIDAADAENQLAIATYDFSARACAIDIFSPAGAHLARLTPAPQGPGRWDWIFAVAGHGQRFIVYAYQGDGKQGRSWLEERTADGALLATGLQRDEGPIAPFWLASRSVRSMYPMLYVLGPGQDGNSTALYSGTTVADLRILRQDTDALIAEPCKRLFRILGGLCLVGQWETPNRVGHLCIIDSRGDVVWRGVGTRGPTGKLNSPSGICLTRGGTVAVADTNNYRCVFFSTSGEQIIAGDVPFRPGQLAAADDGTLAVTNLDHAAGTGPGVVLIAQNGSVVSELGQWGSGGSQLAGPQDVAWSPDGYLYVADTLNNRVAVFDRAGRWVRQFGSLGEGQGRLFHPNAIAVSTDAVFVAQPDGARGRVTMFDLQGNYVRQWQTERPIRDLALGDKGQIVALVEGMGVVTYNALGDVLDVMPWSTYRGATPANPSAFSIDGSQMAVADTGNCR